MSVYNNIEMWVCCLPSLPFTFKELPFRVLLAHGTDSLPCERLSRVVNTETYGRYPS